MKRVLLDQGLAPLAAKLLRDQGWEAIHVADIGLHAAEDTQILSYARANQMTCVTLDHDFHAHLAQSSANGPSVVFLRIQKLRATGHPTHILNATPGFGGISQCTVHRTPERGLKAPALQPSASCLDFVSLRHGESCRGNL